MASPVRFQTASSAALRHAHSFKTVIPAHTCERLAPLIRRQPLRRTSAISQPRLRAYPASTVNTVSTMAIPKSAPNAVIELIKNRRTYYPLSKDIPIDASRVQQIVEDAILHVPSSFNSQSNRVVLLFGDEHDRLWDITRDALKAIVPAENWEPTAKKMATFRGAAGTVLCFEDQEVVESMQAKFALFADKFPLWAVQSNAMLQFTLWTALETEGLGANLQHYNPIIDEKVAETWKVPKTWTLNAQLVFGAKTSEPADKTFQPLEERLKVFGA